MVDVYYFLPSEEVANAVDCGLKLSKWFQKEVVINGENKKCMSALLNPKDDMEKYKSAEYKCVKLEVSSNSCYIADEYLYKMGLKSPVVMDLYLKSIIPVEKYIFGMYRLPECLVTSTVIAGQIGVLNMKLDLPVLFDNSEELYINNIIQTYTEEHNDFTDAMLYSFYCMLAEKGKVNKKEDIENGIAVFIAKNDGKTFTVRIPDLNSF